MVVHDLGVGMTINRQLKGLQGNRNHVYIGQITVNSLIVVLYYHFARCYSRWICSK